MGLGQRFTSGWILGFALLALVGCSMTSPATGPETRVEGATTVSPAGYPTPAAPLASDAMPVRVVASEDRPLRGAPLPAEQAYVDARLEAEVFVLANRVRSEHGRSRLTMRGDLIDIARRHALDMANRGYFSHYSPEGMGPGDRARSGGVRFGAFAENLARVRRSTEPCELAIEGWLDSPGHRRNLLDENAVGYRYTGVGVAIAPDGAVVLAQVFLR
jgi:uncharacterized protein YkwD